MQEQAKQYSYLKEYIPVKQGLRRKRFDVLDMKIILKEYIPVKQGLRQCILSMYKPWFVAQRVYSSKTRIKTLE